MRVGCQKGVIVYKVHKVAKSMESLSLPVWLNRKGDSPGIPLKERIL